MTKPEVSGSDPTLLQARAERDGEEWVINGHKWFTSGAVGAELAIGTAERALEMMCHRRIAEAMERVITGARADARAVRASRWRKKSLRLIENRPHTYRVRVEDRHFRIASLDLYHRQGYAFRALVVRMLRVAGFTSLAGTWSGRLRTADDFDDLPDDLAESSGMR